MIPLVLLGSLSDRRVGQALKDLFSRRVSFLHICGSKLDLSGTVPDFLIYETDTLEQLPVPSGILICKETSRQPGISLCHVEEPEPFQTFLGILSSEDTAGAQLFSQMKLTTITCGLSGKDSLTLSSITSDSAVICLQRTIRSLSGQEIDPGEIPVTLTRPIDRYSLLAAVAVALLSQRRELLDQLHF